jgi:hypothetical protein
VIEAKGTVTREAIRMALEQLLDYQRFLDTKADLPCYFRSFPERTCVI